MKIAFLGASSYIAKDLIRAFSINENVHLDLFGRQPNEIDSWLKINLLNHKCQAKDYLSFCQLTFYDAIINFVGVGNPAQAIQMGSAIFDITHYYDQLVLDYLRHHPKTKYIFFSSGAIYGGNFKEPAQLDTHVSIDMNCSKSNDWYSKAKLYAEIGHRSRDDLNIVDLRVFNYFSSSIDLSTSYFITDIINSLLNEEMMYTSEDNIFRDYLGTDDLYQLLQCILTQEHINLALDCYSKAPIDKKTILEQLKKRYGLHFSYQAREHISYTLNFKLNYYSLNQLASTIGYFPSKTSLEVIFDGIDIILTKK